MRDLLPCIMRAGRKQWLHRNDHKHYLTKPRLEAYKKLLDAYIVQQFAMGTRELLPSDHVKLHTNMLHLLNKPLSVRKTWGRNMQISRQRYQRVKRQNDEWQEEARNASILRHFLIHGTLR